MRRFVLYAAITVLGSALGANVSTSVVDAPNWGAAIPQSLEASRAYF